MIDFLEYTDFDTGRKAAIPVDVVRGVSGADGKPTSIFPAEIGSDGNLTMLPDMDNGVLAKDSYESVMKQLKYFRQFDR